MVELKTPRRYRRHDVVARTVAPARRRRRRSSASSGAARAGARAAPRPAHRPARRLRRLDPGGARRLGGRLRRPRASPRRGLAAARRLGLETLVYTVNEPARMRELAALGAGGIFTDRPDLALRESRAALPVRELEQARALGGKRRRHASSRPAAPPPVPVGHVGDQVGAGAEHLQPGDRSEERLREHVADERVRAAVAVRRRPSSTVSGRMSTSTRSPRARPRAAFDA